MYLHNIEIWAAYVIKRPFIIFAVVVAYLILHWVCTSEYASNDDDNRTLWERIQDNRKLLDFVLVTGLVVVLVCADIDTLTIPARHMLGVCASNIIADILSLARWPLIFTSIIGLMWGFWFFFIDRSDENSEDRVSMQIQNFLTMISNQPLSSPNSLVGLVYVGILLAALVVHTNLAQNQAIDRLHKEKCIYLSKETIAASER